jgi:hypothetical protein
VRRLFTDGLLLAGALVILACVTNCKINPQPVPQPTPSAEPSPTPTPSPDPTAPPSCPPPSRIDLVEMRLAKHLVDATPKVHSKEWCSAHFTNPNLQVDCPYGDETAEGWTLRQWCEAQWPTAWTFRGQPCSAYSPCHPNDWNTSNIKFPGELEAQSKSALALSAIYLR